MEEPDKVVEELEGIFPGRVTRDVGRYLKDWWPLLWITNEAVGKAWAAVKPVNVDEVAALAKFASAKGVPLFVRGGGSSVTGASIPSDGIVVDMQGLNQILDLDEDNRTVTVQAGTKLNVLEGSLNSKGFSLSQFPQSFELATIGGFISTLGTGQYSTAYGGIEDSVLRLEVVLPSGEVVWTRKTGVPRSSVGPDLCRLFIGAEGSLGMVVAAELKIRRLPSNVWKAAYNFSDYRSAVSACKSLLELDVRPAVCRAYNETESAFQFQEQACTLLLVYHFRSKAVLEAVRSEVTSVVESNSVPADPALVDRWLENRFNFEKQIESVRKMGYTLETIEVAARWSRTMELYADAIDSVSRVPGVAGVGAHVSHLYDAGACIYFTILLEPKKETYAAMWDTMARVTRKHDATISHHHGVGILKKVYAADEIPVQLLGKIKKALDPGSVLGPGRLP